MIEVKGLVKDYGSLRAVAGVSFTVRRGDILGFLGPNGAGKSTTMKMITGFLAPRKFVVWQSKTASVQVTPAPMGAGASAGVAVTVSHF